MMSVLGVPKLANRSAVLCGTRLAHYVFGVYIAPHYTLAHNNYYSTKHLISLSRYLAYLKAGMIETVIMAYYEPCPGFGGIAPIFLKFRQ